MTIFCYRSISYAVSTSSGFVIVCFGTGVSRLLSLQPWTLWLYISVLGYQFYCHCSYGCCDCIFWYLGISFTVTITMDVVAVYFGTWVSVLLSLQPWTLWLYIWCQGYYFYWHYSHGHCDCIFWYLGISFTVITALDVVTVHFGTRGITFTVTTAIDVVTVHFGTGVSVLLSLQLWTLWLYILVLGY